MKKLLVFPLFFLIISASAQQNPNVLFIAIDDLNDYVNCMDGAIKAHTPNIDRLAKQGFLFTNAHCQAPICGPSRACIMTGLYPSSSGNYLQVRDRDIKKGSPQVGESTFMPDFFEKHGYKTMAVGKIYHGRDEAGTFDEYGGGYDWFGPKPPQRMNYDPYSRPDKEGGTQTDWGVFPEHDSMMTDYKVAEWAVSKLAEAHNQPFFLAAGFLSPHVPWHAPQRWFDMFPVDAVDTPPYLKNDFDDIPIMAQRVAEAPMMPTTEELIASGEWKNVIQAYLACIAFTDTQIGKLLDALEESPYANNTIVVLWSDHGYHLGEKNRFAKQALWERDTRTVLIFKVPNKRGNASFDDPVQLADIYPTLLDLCGLPAYAMADGHSLKGILDGTQKKWEHPALSFYGVGNIAVRNHRYRLIQYEDGSLELYDLIKDPNEWNNLAAQKKYEKVMGELQSHIPENWVPLSEYSNYNFNAYFRGKSE